VARHAQYGHHRHGWSGRYRSLGAAHRRMAVAPAQAERPGRPTARAATRGSRPPGRANSSGLTPTDAGARPHWPRAPAGRAKGHTMRNRILLGGLAAVLLTGLGAALALQGASPKPGNIDTAHAFRTLAPPAPASSDQLAASIARAQQQLRADPR